MRRLRSVCLALLALLLVAACADASGQRATVAPTEARQASATAEPAPEEPSPTGELEPTAEPAPSETIVPTAAPQASATPAAPAEPAGTLYFLREGELTAYELGGAKARGLGVKAEAFRVAPDGKSIAVLAGGELSLVSPDGELLRPVAGNVGGDLVWAPDGSALAFTSDGGSTGTAGSEVIIADLAAEDTIRTVEPGNEPAWSPEGKRLAFVTYADILVRPDNELRLVNRQGENGWSPAKGILADETFPGPRRTFSDPWWSADGKQIFMIARFSEFVETSWSTIELVDAVEGTAQPVGVVLDIAGRTLRPSPDRTRIAYLSAGAKGTNVLVVHALMVEERSWNPPWYEYEGVDKSITLRDRVEHEYEHVYALAWAPDGRRLAVIFCQQAGDPMGICDFDGTGELRLFDAASGELSEPLLEDVDLRTTLDWAP